MQFLSNLNVFDCCQATTNKKLIYFPTNSCKQQKYLGSSIIWSLESALLGKIQALLQDVLYLAHKWSMCQCIVYNRTRPRIVINLSLFLSLHFSNFEN